jgi:hypothetical protein
MSWLGRNDLDGPLGFSAEEERRRADESRRGAASSCPGACRRPSRAGRPSGRWTGTILSRIRPPSVADPARPRRAAPARAGSCLGTDLPTSEIAQGPGAASPVRAARTLHRDEGSRARSVAVMTAISLRIWPVQPRGSVHPATIPTRNRCRSEGSERSCRRARDLILASEPAQASSDPSGARAGQSSAADSRETTVCVIESTSNTAMSCALGSPMAYARTLRSGSGSTGACGR